MIALFAFGLASILFAVGAIFERKPASRILWITLAFSNGVLVLILMAAR